MRVFVVCTGKCGSTSFFHACKYITNYSCGQEQVMESFKYPDKHIEVNPHLSTSLPIILKHNPNSKWVHLVREKEDCVRSIANISNGEIMLAYKKVHPTCFLSSDKTVLDIARRYYDNINSRIESILGLLSEDTVLKVSIDNIEEDWPRFWNWVGAEGNFDESLQSFSVRKNVTV